MILIIVSSGNEEGKHMREKSKERFKASNNRARRPLRWTNSTGYFTSKQNER
jgi:hypothetical protein